MDIDILFNLIRQSQKISSEVLTKMRNELKRKIDFKKIISTKGNLNYTLCNNALIKKKFKFNFKFNLNKIVKSCIDKKII